MFDTAKCRTFENTQHLMFHSTNYVHVHLRIHPRIPSCQACLHGAEVPSTHHPSHSIFGPFSFLLARNIKSRVSVDSDFNTFSLVYTPATPFEHSQAHVPITGFEGIFDTAHYRRCRYFGKKCHVMTRYGFSRKTDMGHLDRPFKTAGRWEHTNQIRGVFRSSVSYEEWRRLDSKEDWKPFIYSSACYTKTCNGATSFCVSASKKKA
jgi:hypothetical protein